MKPLTVLKCTSTVKTIKNWNSKINDVDGARRCRTRISKGGFGTLKKKDKKEGSSTNFMPDDLLEIICILERGEMHNPYKIIGKRNYFSLIT